MIVCVYTKLWQVTFQGVVCDLVCFVVTHAGSSRAMGRMTSCICDILYVYMYPSMYVGMCLSVYPRNKRLERSTPKHVQMYSMTARKIGQKVRGQKSHRYERSRHTLPVSYAAAAAFVGLQVSRTARVSS